MDHHITNRSSEAQQSHDSLGVTANWGHMFSPQLSAREINHNHTGRATEHLPGLSITGDNHGDRSHHRAVTGHSHDAQLISTDTHATAPDSPLNIGITAEARSLTQTKQKLSIIVHPKALRTTAISPQPSYQVNRTRHEHPGTTKVIKPPMGSISIPMV